MEKNIKHSKRLELLCVGFLALCLVLVSLADQARTVSALQSRVLRLHVIANSDAEADQAVKLLVRDAVLRAAADFFDGSVTADDAEARLSEHLDTINGAAADTLRANGMDYGVKTEIVTEDFPARQYNDLTLPAGRYKAVRVVLGEGAGHNWWCVMFPPLCLPAVTQEAEEAYFTDDEMKILKPEGSFAVRVKVWDWVCDLWAYFSGNR